MFSEIDNKIDTNKIKRIIFDLDDTIIDWKDEYWNSIIETLNELNIFYKQEDIRKFQNALDKYEDGRYKRHDKDKMRIIMQDELGYKLPSNFIDTWLKYLGGCVPEKIDEETIKTLDYLSNKYELVLLSNWFEKSQIERLEKANLLKYFKETYFSENIDMKPSKESFEIAQGCYNYDECIMIGDNIKVDILGALKSNIKPIFINKKNKEISKEISKIIKENNYEIVSINKLEQLIEIL